MEKKEVYFILRNVGIVSTLLISSLSGSGVQSGTVTHERSVPKENHTLRRPVENIVVKEGGVDNINTRHYSTETYAYKQCTWWAYNRALDFGVHYSEYMGNGSNWKNQANYELSLEPVLHSVISFEAGQTLDDGRWYADPTYGHVAFVEAVYSDGSLLVSESGMNLEGEYRTWRISPLDAKKLSYVIGHKS
jgi:surface antigen